MKEVIRKFEEKEIVNCYENNRITSHIIFSDDSQVFIYIENGMIFVADREYNQIDFDDIDSYEAYDTADGVAYYYNSDYAKYISEAFIWFYNTQL